MTTCQGTSATLLLLLLLTSGTSSAAKYFEWVDTTGVTHFGDRAPVGLSFDKKTVRPASGAAQPGIEIGIRNTERVLLKDIRRKEAEIERARQSMAEQVEQRKSRCRQARALYHEATHRKGSAGNGDFKVHRLKMNEFCD